ncbi:MAG TPA: GntR family transcriptional regulator [Anaerolineales bacterium]|nr:GntR family transcriptional regulator [Anaerolineales bacterium]
MDSDLDLENQLVNRKPIKDEIFEILHQRIIAGKYQPGEWLRQEEIASQLGVSQTPVREALDLLVSAGLAEREPYKGVRVMHLSDTEIAESYGMRMFLEVTSSMIAAKRITDRELETLEKIVEKTKGLLTLNDMAAQRILNRQFHNALVAASGNSLLVKMHAIVINTFPDWMLYEYMFRHPELLEENLVREYNEHKAIYISLATHDIENARIETENHFLNLGKELTEFLGINKEFLLEKKIQI